MSNTLAIAAVTSTLRDLLDKVAERRPFDPNPEPTLAGAYCLTKPPNQATKPEGDNHLNLFLYQVTHNAAMRNLPTPGTSLSGEQSPPPLALTLFYLLTAYGKGDDEVLSHRLLGRAMSLLHDSGTLLPASIEASLAAAQLHMQVERVRITPQPLSVEEISKLWTVFQTPYRLSVAYQLSVVLIDSAKPAHSPLPVLKVVIPETLPPYPTLTGLTLPSPHQPSARLATTTIPGDVVSLSGKHLDGTSVTVRFEHPLLAEVRTLTPLSGGTPTQVRVQLPNEPTKWPAGLYAVSVVISRPSEPIRTTNAVPLAIAPRLTQVSASGLDSQHLSTITATLDPQVWPGQRVSLLIAGREYAALPPKVKTSTVQVHVPVVSKETYVVRVRVDGVDTHAVNYGSQTPEFEQGQKVTIP
jgi:hypothetical protein